jgi:phospholipase C
MGYYTEQTFPTSPLADAFAICDKYFCAVMGPTDPNRLYTMAASLDPGKRRADFADHCHKSHSRLRPLLIQHAQQLQARGFLEGLLVA